jgi:osmotically-inducible protein OsmY
MRTARQQKFLMYVVLASVAAVALGPGWAIAAYDQDDQHQYQNQQRYQDQDQDDQSYQQPPRSAQAQGRDMRLEQQIASRLRQQGYGARGEIMILATGNRVILLGTVPDNRTKEGVERAAQQIATRQLIDNRLHVRAQARRVTNAQLERNTNDRLGDELSENVQVQARNGTVTLQGQLDNWRQVADAIDAAFAAGATQVNSQFSVAGAGAMARGEGGGYYPSYGYAPGQQEQPSYPPRGRPGAMGAARQATSSDLRLAQQVADELRQQLPQRQNVQPIQPQSIYVTVQQGTVTLHGYVQSSSQKQQAAQIVQSIQGVRNVRNDLTILSTRGPTGQAGGQEQWQDQGDQAGWQGQGEQSGRQSQSSRSQSQQGMGGQGQYSQSGQGGAQQEFGTQGQYGQGAQMGGGQAGMSASDMNLARQVVQQLRQQLAGIQNVQIVRPGTIYVMASQGTVILHGIVPSRSISQQAAQIARAVPGVRSLQSTLRVSRPPGSYPSYGYIPGPEQPGAAGRGMAGQDQGGQGSTQMRQITESGQMAASQSSQSDMALAQRVALKLRQQLPSFYNVQIATPGTIYVKVSNGAVTLDGFVSNDDARRSAEQIAKSVRGVQNVKNSLSIVGINQTLDYAPTDDDPPAYQDQSFDDQQDQDQQQIQRNGSNPGEPY